MYNDEIIYNKTNGKCHLCAGEIDYYEDWEIDHNIPFSKGGSDEMHNLLPAHRFCNRSKGNQSSTAIRKRNRITLNDVYRNDDAIGWILLIFGGILLYGAYKQNQRRQEIINYYSQQNLQYQLNQISNSFNKTKLILPTYKYIPRRKRYRGRR